MNRLGCMFGALLAAVVLGVGLVVALPRETTGTSELDVSAPYEAELQLAQAQGLEVLEGGIAAGPVFERIVSLAPSQCVALIAASIGPDTLTAASLTIETGSTSESAASGSGTLVHLAICALMESSVAVSFRVGTDRAPYGASTVRYAILTGPMPIDPSSYQRLSISTGMRASLDARVAIGRGHALLGEGTTLREGITIMTDRAVLLPVAASTYVARRALVGFGTRVPAIVSSPGDPIDPFATATDVPSPPTMIARAGTLRLLLAIDAGALGGDCVALALTRLDDPVTAIPITRIAHPSLEEVTLAASDPAVAIDVICPADGLFGYGVPANVGGQYALEVLARPAPEGAHAIPFTGRLAPTLLPLVVTRRIECSAGSEQACIDLAVLARDGVHGAGTAAQVLEPHCTAHGGRTCALRAGLEPDPVLADRFERRACATGELPSCLRHAATLRRARNLEDSLRIYRFACDRGEGTACAAVSTFAEWSLAPPVEVPLADRLP